MPEVAKVTVQAPENPVSVSSPETIVQAAIQTGAAAERTEQAAAEATQAAAEAKTEATKSRSIAEELTLALRPELEKISERLAALETMEEEEQEEREENTSNSQEIAGAAIVELDEPPVVKRSQPNTQTQTQPKPERKSGGFLKRLFLNR